MRNTRAGQHPDMPGAAVELSAGAGSSSVQSHVFVGPQVVTTAHARGLASGKPRTACGTVGRGTGWLACSLSVAKQLVVFVRGDAAGALGGAGRCVESGRALLADALVAIPAAPPAPAAVGHLPGRAACAGKGRVSGQVGEG